MLFPLSLTLLSACWDRSISCIFGQVLSKAHGWVGFRKDLNAKVGCFDMLIVEQ